MTATVSARDRTPRRVDLRTFGVVAAAAGAVVVGAQWAVYHRVDRTNRAWADPAGIADLVRVVGLFAGGMALAGASDAGDERGDERLRGVCLGLALAGAMGLAARPMYAALFEPRGGAFNPLRFGTNLRERFERINQSPPEYVDRLECIERTIRGNWG